jgi:prepilin-type N-terminal cleavage/methylation domain-containing protein
MIKRTKKAGFTLLEILLTLVLFGMGVVGIAGLFGSVLDSSLDAEYTETAMNLAQARMEQIRNFAYGSIPSDSKAQVAGFPLFQRQVSVTESPIDLKQVTVTVYWQFKNREVSEQLVTYVSKN